MQRLKVEVHFGMPVDEVGKAEDFLEEVRFLASEKYGVNWVHTSIMRVQVRDANQPTKNTETAH